MKNIDKLFNYYIEQSKHTENLWIEITKFFTGLLTAIVASIAFLIKEATIIGPLIALMSGLGMIFSLFAAGIVFSYQRLIREWVKKKDKIEDMIYNESEPELSSIGIDFIIPMRKQKKLIQPAAIGMFLTFAIVFLISLIISMGYPNVLGNWFGK